MAPLYLFVDEAGNFDFRLEGTKYFVFTVLSTTEPVTLAGRLLKLRYDLLSDEVTCGKYSDNGYFHASEDKQAVRDKVFEELAQLAGLVRVDSVIAEKRKANPTIRVEEELYRRVAQAALRYAHARIADEGYELVVVVLGSIFTKKKRGAIVGALKHELKLTTATRYEIYFHSAACDLCIQAADYACWAIYRKWENDDPRALASIKRLVRTQFAIFARGTTVYY